MMNMLHISHYAVLACGLLYMRSKVWFGFGNLTLQCMAFFQYDNGFVIVGYLVNAGGPC